MIKIADEVVKADVLILGGGIAGMQAAIAAAEKGSKVLVVEKAHTRRSGDGGTGTDHFMCYIPEFHGTDVDLVMEQVHLTMEGEGNDWDIMRKLMLRSFEVVKKWESYGINMRPTGEYNFEGHTLPGNQHYHLKYDGHNQKPILHQKALDLGVKILNHTVATELLTNGSGRAVGAIALDISKDEPKMIVLEAKAIVLTVGHAVRLYPGVHPGCLCNDDECPASAGALAMAYRIGTKMINCDLAYSHAGPKYFARSGKGTWIGVMSDIEGNPVGAYVSKPNRKQGDPMMDIWTTAFRDRMKNGSGPTYVNCTETSEEDLSHMIEAFNAEGDTSLTDYMNQFGIDLHKDMIEFGTYEYQLFLRGIEIDINTMTSTQGMFAAGNIVGNVRGSITNASVLGMIAGENASDYAAMHDFEEVKQDPKINECAKFYSALLDRKDGAHWSESNKTLQQLMNEYAGLEVRSGSLFKAGIKYLGDLRRYSREQFKAENSHELMRCLEVLDLIDIGEVVMVMSDNRKESRPPFHNRSDYIYTDPLLNGKFQTLQKTKEGVIMEFRPQVVK